MRYTAEQIETLNNLFPITFDIKPGEEVTLFEVEGEDDSDEMFYYYNYSYIILPDLENDAVRVGVLKNTYSIYCDGDLVNSEDVEEILVFRDGSTERR